MATNGTTNLKVPDSHGKERTYPVPMTISQYVTKAERDVVVTPGVNPEYVQWVNQRRGK